MDSNSGVAGADGANQFASVAADHEYTNKQLPVSSPTATPTPTVAAEDSEAVEEPTAEVFEVEKIVGYRVEKGVEQLKVRWANYGPKDDTWEPKDSLCLAPAVTKMVEDFMREREAKSKRKSHGGIWGGNWTYANKDVLSENAKFFKKVEAGEVDVAFDVSNQKRKSAPKFSLSEQSLGISGDLFQTHSPERKLEKKRSNEVSDIRNEPGTSGMADRTARSPQREGTDRKRGGPKKGNKSKSPAVGKSSSPQRKFHLQLQKKIGHLVGRGKSHTGTMTKAEQKKRMKRKFAQMEAKRNADSAANQQSAAVAAPIEGRLASSGSGTGSPVDELLSTRVSPPPATVKKSKVKQNVVEKLSTREGNTALRVTEKLMEAATAALRNDLEESDVHSSVAPVRLDAAGNFVMNSNGHSGDDYSPTALVQKVQHQTAARKKLDENLFEAVSKLDLDSVKRYVVATQSGKANPNQADDMGTTLLMMVALEKSCGDRNNQCRIADALLQADADVNAQTVEGVTALHMAVSVNHLCLAAKLINYGAKVNAITRPYSTPGKSVLLLAAEKASHTTIDMLVKKGADLGFVSLPPQLDGVDVAFKRTPRETAVHKHRSNAVEKLQKYETMQNEAFIGALKKLVGNVGYMDRPVFKLRTVLLRESSVAKLEFFWDEPLDKAFIPMLFCPTAVYTVGTTGSSQESVVTEMECSFKGFCPIVKVELNGVPQSTGGENNFFTTSLTPLQRGLNTLKLYITDDNRIYPDWKVFVQGWFLRRAKFDEGN